MRPGRIWSQNFCMNMTREKNTLARSGVGIVAMPRYKKKVLVFGNSFFSTGQHSGQLSWWFSRLFQDFMFVWTPEVDWDLVGEYQPDYLLA